MTTKWSLGLHAKLGEETYISDLSGTVSQVTVAGTVAGQSATSAATVALMLGIAGVVAGQSETVATVFLLLGMSGATKSQSGLIGQILPGTSLAGMVAGQSATAAVLTVNSGQINWQFISSAWNDEDAIDYVVSASWNLGFAGPYEPLAKVSTFSAVLKNSDRRFSPEYSQGPYFKNFTLGRLIRVQSVYNGDTRTHFLGWIDGIDPMGNTKGPRKTTITAQGLLSRAQEQEVFIPVMEGVTGDLVVDEILDRSNMMPPGFVGKWILGSTGLGELGISTWLGGSADYLEAEVGVSTFTMIGDQWQDGVSVFGALRDVAGREGGRIFVNRDGKVVFWNREHLILDTTRLAEFDNQMSDMIYQYGDLFVNKVIVKARPRKIGSSPEVLGSLDKATKISTSQVKAINFRYTDPSSGVRISGKNVVEPVGSIDYTANGAKDGNGTDYTASVLAVLLEESGTRSRVEFTNNAGVDVWLQGAQVRGLKITDWGEVDTYVEDSTSVAQYGPRPMTYPFVMDDVAEAENLAAFILEERQGPRGRVVQMTVPSLANDDLTMQSLARTIGDRIAIKEGQTEINAAYFIINENHALLSSGDYRVTWGVEPASVNQYWLLGVATTSELGQTVHLA